MKKIVARLIREFLWNELGQTLPLMAMLMVAMLGVAGLTIDTGHAYVVRGHLQNSTNAAALAAAGVVYNTSTFNDATAYANNYSSAASGNKNYSTGLGAVTTTVTTKCLNLLMAKGTSCVKASPANAVQVNQTTSVTTFFMRLFGVSSLNVSTTATASMLGIAQPWNVAIIVDSTGSMATADTNCGNVTEFQCALSGVQSLLQSTNPACPVGVACPSGSNFRVALFTFPNILTSVNGALPVVKSTTIDSLSNDTNCGGNPGSYSNWQRQPLAAPYTLPKPGAILPIDSAGRTYLTYKETSAGANPGTTWNATYQITPFLSDYYLPSAVSGLNSSSDLVKAVGYGSIPGCLTYTFGIDGASGGGSNFGNTYFASAIYAAQSALTAQQQANPGSKNAIIFLSDGQSNASYYSRNVSAYGKSDSTNQLNKAYQFPEGPAGSEVGPTSTGYPVPAYLTPAVILPAHASLGYDTLSTSPAGGTRSGTAKGIYPDWYDQCQQAIMAGQYASNAGTQVYSVAYGAEGSGCSNGWGIGLTDTTTAATGTFNQPFATGSDLLPCTTMEDIASSWSYFYSDNNQSAANNLGCSDQNHSTVSLQNIFQSIAASFTTPRLLPNNAQ